MWKCHSYSTSSDIGLSTQTGTTVNIAPEYLESTKGEVLPSLADRLAVSLVWFLHLEQDSKTKIYGSHGSYGQKFFVNASSIHRLPDITRTVTNISERSCRINNALGLLRNIFSYPQSSRKQQILPRYRSRRQINPPRKKNCLFVHLMTHQLKCSTITFLMLNNFGRIYWFTVQYYPSICLRLELKYTV